MKKSLAMLLTGAMAVSVLAGCGAKTEEAPAATEETAVEETTTEEAPAEEATEEAAPEEGKVYNIGICQLLEHVALDAATEGFQAALVEKLGEENVVFDFQNAQGEQTNCATITTQFVTNGVDLIMANATAPLQAAAAATNTIPVLGTSVTDYATALDIADWTGVCGNNVSGTSDLAPLDQQEDLFLEILPDAKTIGILYCSAEPNSIYQAQQIEKFLEEDGLSYVEFSFSDSNDLASVVQSAVGAVDAIYIPTDNTAAANTEVIRNVLVPAGIPAIVGEEGICGGCGVATLSISYYDIGYVTGEMAYDILVNGADVTTMAVKTAPQVTKKYNAEICAELGIEIPEGYVAIGE